MLTLNTKKFSLLSLGALLVIAGVVLKNSAEQLGKPNHSVAKPLGMVAFVVGWLIVAYSVAITRGGKLQWNKRTLMAFGTAFGIVYAVVQMKKYMVKGQKPPMIFPALFAGSWLLLGYVTGNLNGTTGLGLLAAITVLVSMMGVLPWQRKKKVIDGPGMPMFVIGWILLALSNSM